MFANYFAILMRIALRSRLHSIIIIFGLTLGLSVSLMIMLYAWFETHYDTNHPEADRLYRVETTISSPGRADRLFTSTMGPLAGVLEEELSSVELAARMRVEWHNYSVEGYEGFTTQTYFVDPGFLTLFPLDFIEGQNGDLSDPTAIYLSESRAKLIFGDEPAVGQLLNEDDGVVLTVKGIFKDFQENSHLAIDTLAPLTAGQMYTSREQLDTSWRNIPVQTYVRLRDNAEPAVVRNEIKSLIERFSPQDDTNNGTQTGDFSLMAVPDIHLEGGPYNSRLKLGGNKTQLTVLTSIGVLVLIVACFNYVNMATARAMTRAREVAMRKVVGAKKRHLFAQFLSETFLYVIFSWFIALVLIDTALPYVNSFIGRDLTTDYIWQSDVIALQIIVIIGVTFASGLYPTLYLSRFNPIRILKEQTADSTWKISLRTILVVLQFAVSVGLIIASSIIYVQTKYARNIDLGFDKSDTVVLYGVGRGRTETVRLTSALDKAIANQPGVVSISGSQALPSWNHNSEARLGLIGMQEDNFLSFNQLAVDLDYFETYRVKSVAGRLYSEDFATDRLQWDLENRNSVDLPIILNETGARQLGFATPQEAVDTAITIEVSTGRQRAARIVGVVEDFHFKSIHNTIDPMVFYPDPTRFTAMTVRIDATLRGDAIDSIRQGWKQVLPYQNMGYEYLEQNILAQYLQEERLLVAVGILAVVAILIALLGLYGLAAFHLERRIKEIGIRKVLGAESKDIVQLVTWQFARPVIMANLVAWPITWFFMNEWLAGFAYRIEVSLIPFLITGLVAVGFAAFTVAWQALSIARANPIRALRYE